MIKEIEALVEVSYLINGNITQKFNITTQRKTDLKFFFDSRYTIYNRMIKKIEEHTLSIDKGFTFISLNNTTESFILTYRGDLIDIKELQPFKFIISDVVPSNPGCDYCVYKNMNHEFIYCGFIDKVLTKTKKTCRFFKQGSLYKS